jgi:hypothetical protein
MDCGDNKMSVWNHIILEGYCCYSWNSKKQHKMIEMKDIKDILSKKKQNVTIRKNDSYISPKKRPFWCMKSNKKFIPQFNCLCYSKNKKCPFFAYSEVREKDKKIMLQAWWKKAKCL